MEPLVVFTVLAVMGVAASLTLAVWRTLTSPRDGGAFEDALEAITSGSELSGEDVALTVSKSRGVQPWNWSRWWAEAAERSGREVTDPGGFGRAMAAVAVLALLFGILVYPTGPAAAVLPVAAVLLVRGWLALEQAKRRAALDRQLPLLLSAMRSQIHAGQTIQSAIMDVSKDLPAPLGDEMRIVRDEVNVSVPLEVALDRLSHRVSSRLVQFLVSSMGIAIRSGSDLVPQLITIEEIVRQRARIVGKIRSAIALAKPTSYLALAAPPAMAVWMVLSTPGYISYFLGEGMLVGLIGVLLYIGGAIAVRIMVSNVEKI